MKRAGYALLVAGIWELALGLLYAVDAWPAHSLLEALPAILWALGGLLLCAAGMALVTTEVKTWTR